MLLCISGDDQFESYSWKFHEIANIRRQKVELTAVKEERFDHLEEKIEKVVERFLLFLCYCQKNTGHSKNKVNFTSGVGNKEHCLHLHFFKEINSNGF